MTLNIVRNRWIAALIFGRSKFRFEASGRLSLRMKASSLIIFTALVLTGCAHRDPIDRIVKKDSADQHFPSGPFAVINLPATAPVTEVVSNALGQPDLSGLSVKHFTVLETRQVKIHADYGIPPELVNYTAVLVDTSFGQKVVLLQFQKHKQNTNGWWWSHVYDLESN